MVYLCKEIPITYHDHDVFRQYYESLIVEARSKQESSIAEAVEQTVVKKMQELQNEIEKCEEEKTEITEVRLSRPCSPLFHSRKGSLCSANY